MSRIVRRSGGEAVVGHNGVMGYGGRLSGSRWLALYVCDPWGWLTLTVTAPQSGPDLNPHGPDLRRCDSRDAANDVSAGQELVMCVRGGTRSPPVVVHHRKGDLSPAQANTARAGRARISQATRGGCPGLPGRPGHVTCGNDQDGEPGPGRGSRSTTLDHQG